MDFDYRRSKSYDAFHNHTLHHDVSNSLGACRTFEALTHQRGRSTPQFDCCLEEKSPGGIASGRALSSPIWNRERIIFALVNLFGRTIAMRSEQIHIGLTLRVIRDRWDVPLGRWQGW